MLVVLAFMHTVQIIPHSGAFKPKSRDELKGAVDTCHVEDTTSSVETPYPSLVVFDLDGTCMNFLSLLWRHFFA